MINYEHAEALIARHKALTQELMDTGSQAVAIELIRVSTQLAKLGFTQIEDEADWLPPFTPDRR